MSATYLYGIVAADQVPDIGGGIPDGSAAVRGLGVDGLVGLVGAYDGPGFSELPKEDILRLLIIHQQVLEKVTGEYPVLPARFGTLLESEDEVIRALSHFRALLRAALNDVGGGVEVDLSATWDLPHILNEVRGLPGLAEVVGQGDEEDDQLALKLRVGRLVQEQVEERRDQYRRRVVGELVRHARDAQPNPRPGEDIVFNVAFLVDRADLAAFDAAVDRLGAEHEGRLSLRYVGPLPPYSFGTVDLDRPDPERIRTAARLLGLGDRVTAREVQEAYRGAAARLHPDVNRADPRSGERFAALREAYGELSRYLSGTARGDPDHDDAERDLSDEVVSGAILLRVTREPAPLGEELGDRHESPVGA
jgi:hypothetical protein